MKINKQGITHQIAMCLDCEEGNQEYQDSKARKWAYNHAKSKGHHVIVETGTAIHYHGEE